jgi:hypothetical protein
MPQTGSITPLHLKLILCQLGGEPQAMLTVMPYLHARITALQKDEEGLMTKKTGLPKAPKKVDPAVAAALTGVIYQAELFNRQARVNVPEQEVIAEVISLWRNVTDALAHGPLPVARAKRHPAASVVSHK